MFFLCLASVVQNPECLWESSILCVATISLFLLLYSVPLCENTTADGSFGVANCLGLVKQCNYEYVSICLLMNFCTYL